MERFVQPVPPLEDVYAGDPVLRSWLDRLLGQQGHAAAAERLAALAAEVAGPLREAHADAEAHPPRLIRYDGWGARVDRVQTAPGWERLRRAAAEHAVVGLPYLAEARKQWGTGTRVVQHALLHLYGPESATFTCPVAMADGAAALLSRPDIDPVVRDEWLPKLTSTDPDVTVTSGQWMTESQGGSDISRTGTVAEPDATGGWRLTGEKWFCSAIDSAMAVALARPAGADQTSRALVPFLVPRYQDGVRLHRLKDKLGTRAVPTAEVGLHGALGVPLGDPAEPGLARMMTLVVVTRLHNAAAAAAGMRRGLEYAKSYAEVRTVASGRLADSPLHRATLGQLAVDAQAAFALAAHGFALLGRAEVDGDETAAEELRLVAPVAKLTTGKLAVASASEYLECFGGAGYVEDTGLPRLLRDAQVLPIWEGTTNVLALDVLRAIRRGGGMKALQHRVAAACDAAIGRLPIAAAALSSAASRLAGDLDTAAAQPESATVQAGARGLALRLGYVLAAALLVEHAGWAAEHGDEAAGVAATLWTLHRLGNADISAEAAQFAAAL
jgi:alkylation response protein AidB-like acyl-CoA dehydrogenase